MMREIRSKNNDLGFPDSITITLTGKDYNAFAELSNKLLFYGMFNDKFSQGDAKKLSKLLENEPRFSDAKSKTLIAETYNYFKKQKGFDYKLIFNNKPKNKRSKDPLDFDWPVTYTLNKLLTILFKLAQSEPSFDKKTIVIKRLLEFTNHWEFPKSYSDRQRKIIVGYVVAKLGYLKSEKHHDDADYNSYLEDSVKYYNKK